MRVGQPTGLYMIVHRPISPARMGFIVRHLIDNVPFPTDAEVGIKFDDYRKKYPEAYAQLGQYGVSDESLKDALSIYNPDRIASLAEFAQRSGSAGDIGDVVASQFGRFVEIVELIGHEEIAAGALRDSVTPVQRILEYDKAMEQRENISREFAQIFGQQ